MKWIKYLYNLRLLIYFVLFFSVACKREDLHPDNHGLSKWLLSKVYVANSKDSVLLEEFIYNGNKHPQLARYYSGSNVANADTFFYDQKGRLSQIRSWFIGGSNRTKRIHYNSGSWIDTIWVLDPQASGKVLDLFSYKYGSDTVRQYIHSPGNGNPVIDSICYTYDQRRNLSSWLINPRYYGLPVITSYPQYDDCYNIYRYLGMNVYLPWTDMNINLPFLSRNNHLMREKRDYQIINYGPVVSLYQVTFREYQVDPLGLITAALEKSPNGGMTRYIYQYIPSE